MLSAKAGAPCPLPVGLGQPALERAADDPLTLFSLPYGYLLTDWLSAALKQRGRPVVWLRLGPEDRDPASFLLSIIASAGLVMRGFGAATRQQMRKFPGPVSGWPALFKHLGEELAGSMPPSAALVIEDIHQLSSLYPTLGLFCTYLLPELPPGLSCILIAHDTIPLAALPTSTVLRRAADLRMDLQAGLALVESEGASLTKACIQRTLALAGGRAAALSGLIAASNQAGPGLAQQIVKSSRDTPSLLARIARACFASQDVPVLQALALAVHLEYTHPELIRSVFSTPALLAGPWFQSLGNDWMRIRRIWQLPLQTAFRRESESNYTSLRRAAEYLEAEGASAQAISAYLELQDFDSAAQIIAGLADEMMSLGQWEGLSRWLGQLPDGAMHAFPWLLYARGEIAAFHGSPTEALSDFTRAAGCFTELQDRDGASFSLLACSTIDARQGDGSSAWSSAQAARELLEVSGNSWQQSLASWHLGSLAAASGDPEAALNYFSQAAASANEESPYLKDRFQQAEALASSQRNLNIQTLYHQRALFNALRGEKQAAGRLHSLIESPPDQLDALLSRRSWLQVPLFLKLEPGPDAGAPLPEAPVSWIQRLRGRLQRSAWRLAGRQPPSLTPLDLPLPTPPAAPPLLQSPPWVASPRLASAPAPQEASPAGGSPAPEPAGLPAPKQEAAAVFDARPQPEPQSPEEKQPVALFTAASSPPSASLPQAMAETGGMKPTLAVYCLGPFRVYQGDRPVENWSSRKGLSIFKYLVVNHPTPVSKEILMDTFWPDADAEAARRNLHQAIYALRQALRTKGSEIQHILFEKDRYAINPAIQVWLDFKEFEIQVRIGQRLEKSRALDEAMSAYGIAEGLYQGEFFAEDLYEDWLQAPRQNLSQTYLTLAHRLAQYYYERGEYAAAIALSRRILTIDSLQEEAHQTLMRCYLAQGQRHLARSQYQICVQALKTQLDLPPSPETQAIFREIARG